MEDDDTPTPRGKGGPDLITVLVIVAIIAIGLAIFTPAVINAMAQKQRREDLEKGKIAIKYPIRYVRDRQTGLLFAGELFYSSNGWVIEPFALVPKDREVEVPANLVIKVETLSAE